MTVHVAALGRHAAAHIAVGARVGRIHLGLRARRCGAAVAVIGHRDVELARGRVHIHPLRPVHLRRPYGVSRDAGVDVDLLLVGEAERRSRDQRVGDSELHPLARAVVIELGDIELAAVQVLVARGHAVGGRGVSSRPDGGGHPLVDVLVLRVAAHVHRDGLAHHGQAEGGILMSEAAQAGTLLHHRRRAVRIDLHHETLAEPLVAVVVAAVDAGTGLAGVPALVLVGGAGRFPLVAAVGSGGGGDVAAVAYKRSVDLGGAFGLVARSAEVVARPVLLCGQQRAPQRLAVAAVVHRAAGLGTVGGELGDEQRVAAGRARQFHLRGAGDAAIEGGVHGHFEDALGVLLDFGHRHAVAVHLDVHLARRPGAGGGAVGMQHPRGDVLVVHGQQGTVIAVVVAHSAGRQAVVLDAVVAVAHALVIAGVGAVVLVGRHAGGQRVAAGQDDACGVACRHGIGVSQGLGHCGEAQQGGSGRRRRSRCGHHRIVTATAGGQGHGGEHGGEGAAQAAAQHIAAAQA